MKKNTRKKEELIHVKFEYDELMQSKRDILSLEMGLLQILKILKRYHTFRVRELNKKIELHKKIKDMNKSMRNLQITLPTLKIPEILKKDEEKSEFKVEETSSDQNLESQLQEIQNRLKDMQR